MLKYTSSSPGIEKSRTESAKIGHCNIAVKSYESSTYEA